MSVGLNVLTAVKSSPLNVMPSKHNLPKLRTMRPLTSDMGPRRQHAVNSMSHSCEAECVNSIDGRVPSSAGEQMVTKEHLACLFFRLYETCMLLNAVAKREGDVYVLRREYARSADVCVFSSMLVAQLRLTLQPHGL